MSRSLADRTLHGASLRVALSPDRVELVPVPRLGRRGVSQGWAVACTPRQGEPRWRAALDALNAALPELASKADEASVILSNHFVRYLLLPWHDELTGTGERLAAARHRFASVYNESVDEWELMISDAEYGQNSLASAVDRPLLEEIRATFRKAGMRVVSVQPYFMASFNAFLMSLDPNGAFVLAEHGRLCLGALHGGAWQSFSSRRLYETELSGPLIQEITSLELAEPLSSLAVYAPQVYSLAWPEDARPPVRRLQPAMPPGGVSCPMALCGVN